MTGFAEGGGLPPADERRIFKVPVEYIVKADLYVLAASLVEAREKAKQTDLEELVGFNDEQLWVETQERLKILDIEISDIHTIHARPCDDDPREHPDYYLNATKS